MVNKFSQEEFQKTVCDSRPCRTGHERVKIRLMLFLAFYSNYVPSNITRKVTSLYRGNDLIYYLWVGVVREWKYIRSYLS